MNEARARVGVVVRPSRVCTYTHTHTDHICAFTQNIWREKSCASGAVMGTHPLRLLRLHLVEEAVAHILGHLRFRIGHVLHEQRRRAWRCASVAILCVKKGMQFFLGESAA